jgi:arabinofuranosyltransferase
MIPRRDPSPRLRRLAATAALLLLAVVHGARFRPHLTDDAFIPLRYLANWLAGHGLVYNPGERVWGYTDFLWIAALTPPVALGIDPLAAARGLGVLASAALFAWVLARAPLGGGAARGWNPAGALLLATSGPFLVQAWSGLETAFFSLLAVATLALHAAGSRHATRAFAAGLAASLATLTRPEGLFLFAVLLVDAALERRSSSLPLRARLGALALGFAPVALAFELCMWSYYAALWPNSIDAKVGLSLEQVRRGLHYAAVFARNHPVPVLVPLLAAPGWRSAGPETRLWLRAAALFALLPVAVGGDWMLGYRLFHPLIGIGAVLAPFALAGVVARSRAWIPERAAALGIVAVFGAANLAATLRDRHVTVASERTLVYAGVRIGEWMRANLPPDTLLATNTAGSIPYASRLPIVDMMGLNDRSIAQRRDLPERWRGIEKGDGRYVLSRRPDYVQLGSFLGSPIPLFLSDIELFALEEFHRSYELVRFEIDPQTTLRLWRRRERPRAPLEAEEIARYRRIAERQLERSAFRY